MNKDNIIRLFELLTIQNQKDMVDWVMGSCPFAPWTHSSGRDRSPSFGVSVRNRSRYNCFSCGHHGKLAELPTQLMFYRKENLPQYDEALQFIQVNDGLGDVGLWEDGFVQEDRPISEIDASVLLGFSPNLPRKFMQDRGITKADCVTYGFRYDLEQQRVVLPVYDQHNRLAAIRGRQVVDDPWRPKYRLYIEHSPEGDDPKAFGLWYGMDAVLDRNKLLVLVEGEFDRITLHKSGEAKNAWASMGASLSRAQIKTLIETGMPVALFFDDDAAGHEASDVLYTKLHGLVPIYRIMDYCGCKDADQIVREGKIKKALRSIKAV